MHGPLNVGHKIKLEVIDRKQKKAEKARICVSVRLFYDWRALVGSCWLRHNKKDRCCI